MKKILNINLSNISEDCYLRNDEKFYSFYKDNNWNVFNVNNKKLMPLKNIIFEKKENFIYEDDEEYFGIPTGSSYIDENGSIIDVQIVTKDDHPNRLKYKIDENSILLSSLRLAKAPAMNFDKLDYDKYVFSNGFYIFGVKDGWNEKFVMYLLRMPQLKEVLDNNIYRGIGISSFKSDDLYKILVPKITLDDQLKFCKKIFPYENKINELKAKIKPLSEVINDVFLKYFDYDEKLFNNLEKGMTFGTQKCHDKRIGIIDIKLDTVYSYNENLRFSFRSKNKLLNEILSVIKKKECLKINDISIEIIKGIQPEYSEFGIPVIKIANLKNEYIDTEFTEFANEAFCKKLKEEKFVKKKDIIICSIGKGSLGKVDMVDEDYEAIPSVDNYILRIDQDKYLPEFLTYYLRSIFGVVQFELNYSGATNQIHIYDNDILNFYIPNIPIELQEKIVIDIENKLKEQKNMKNEISSKSKEISNYLFTLLSE